MTPRELAEQLREAARQVREAERALALRIGEIEQRLRAIERVANETLPQLRGVFVQAAVEVGAQALARADEAPAPAAAP